jgi:preprotein translocase subunit YajC
MLITHISFTANLGGVMSLCLGFSLLSLIEVVYFFTIRQINDRRRHAKEAKNELRVDNVIWPTKNKY